MAEVRMTIRDAKTPVKVPIGNPNGIRLRAFDRNVLELEGIHFHTDSAVLLPDYQHEPPTPDDDIPHKRITSLVVLGNALRFAEKNADKKLLIAGHADTTGSAGYNVLLTWKRADNVRHALMGDRYDWIQVALGQHKTEDVQQILSWAARDWGWACDPGPIDDHDSPKLHDATKAFKQAFNEEFGAKLTENGVVDRDTWGAFFDLYMRELTQVLDTDESGLAALRGKVQLIGPTRDVGCGKSFPIEQPDKENFRSQTNRRVELVFFEQGEEPNFKCHPAKNVCHPKDCEAYNPLLYNTVVVPVGPLEPHVQRTWINLRPVWKDPAGGDHPFPADFPFKAIYDEDASGPEQKVAPDGTLIFVADRTRTKLRLGYDQPDDRWLASAPAGSTETPPERWVKTAEVQALVDKGFRVWKLPKKWSFYETDWEIPGVGTYSDTEHAFTNLGATDAVGTKENPVTARMLPGWQFVRMTYFDRKVKKRLPLPPIFLEAFNAAPKAGALADASSNWTSDKGNQGLPWLLQRTADKKDAKKPDKDTALRFRTVATTYVDSTAADADGKGRVLATKGGTAPSDAEAFAAVKGAASNIDFTKANAKRMAFYDLPPLWKSQKYFARLSGWNGGTSPTADDDVYEKLAAKPTSDDKPLVFSLDDIVLCHPSGSRLAPVTWNKTTDRAAIFSNTLLNGPGLGDVGPYRPDGGPRKVGATDNFKSYISEQVKDLDSRNYIADYPEWPRLVIADGNAYDAFDRRTTEPDDVVGARAAVRWVDSTAISKANPPGQSAATQPAGPAIPTFFVQQPYFSQDHPQVTPGQSGTRTIGRFDIVHLRCCDLEGDTEVAVILCFFRFFFDFISTGYQPTFNKAGATGLGLTGAAADAWADTALRSIPGRWTGPDGAFNPGPSWLVPKDNDTSPNKLKTRVVWFCQAQPQNKSHFVLHIMQGVAQAPPAPANEWIRAYMGSSDGVGCLDKIDNGPRTDAANLGWFVSAHETGHGGSLNDEYIEPAVPDPNQLAGAVTGNVSSFSCYTPGSPYSTDYFPMMKSDFTQRARNSWQLAEWMRVRYGRDFQVQLDTYTYELPHHADAPRKTYVTWPLVEQRDQTLAKRGKFDAYFHALGEEQYTKDVLPKLATPNAKTFKGQVTLIVKMFFDFKDTSNPQTNHAFMTAVETAIKLAFDGQFVATGTAAGGNYSPVAVIVSPRFRANKYATPHDQKRHFTVKVDAAYHAVKWDTDEELHWPASTAAASFPPYFREMLGLANAATTAPAALIPVVSKVLGSANVLAWPGPP